MALCDVVMLSIHAIFACLNMTAISERKQIWIAYIFQNVSIAIGIAQFRLFSQISSEQIIVTFPLVLRDISLHINWL